MNLLHLIWQLPLFVILFVVFFITFIGENSPHAISWSNVIIYRLVQLIIFVSMVATGYGIVTSITGVF